MASDKPLAGKVALITGSSKGIGAATATHLASLGANVVINYASSSAPAEKLVASLGAENAIAIQADISTLSGVQSLVDATVAKWGKIDIVVANAGVMTLAELEALTEEAYDKTFNTNVKGPLFLVQKSVPHMSTNGRVILFSTTQCTASTVTPNYLGYVASKGAIEQATRVLSKDLARKGITVNCVAPGPTGTDLFFEGKSEQVLNFIKGLNPQGRLGTPEEIASVVGWLAREESSWISGQVIKANGGMA